MISGGATYKMRVLELFNDLYVVKLDVQELINRFQSAPNGNVVLKFYGDFMVHKCFEKTDVEQLA